MAETKKHRTVHWKAPVLMMLPATAGIGLALGQHFYYQHLNGRATDGSETKYSQSITTGIGTGMAFLVRSFLVLAIGTAYAQLFWQQLRHRRVTFTEIDSLFTVLTSLMDLLRWRIWVHHPLLAIVALLAWLLPLTAVVAPTALTTHWSEHSRETYITANMPVPDFNRSSYAILGSSMTSAYYNWRGSQYTLNRLTLATATGGQVLPGPVPAVNSSYTVDFYGPSLQCQPPPADFNQSFQTLITDLEQGKLLYLQILYLSWRPNATDNLPWLQTLLEDGFAESGSSLIGPADQPATLYFAFGEPHSLALLQCTMMNASYVVDISNSDGIQTQHVREVTPQGSITTIAGYQTAADDTLRKIMAYQSILASFFGILQGSIIHPQSADTNTWSTDTTQIMATSLGLTDELYPILTESDELTDYTAVAEPDVASSGKPFARSAEELFQNITLSLMAFERYRTNFSNTEQKHTPTNVTVFSPYIVYRYSPKNLILAYASAAGVCLTIIVIGSIVLFTSGKSFTNNFTTVMRTTNNSKVEALVTQDDKDGGDPLPKHLAKATFDFTLDTIVSEDSLSSSVHPKVEPQMVEHLPKVPVVRAKSLPAREPRSMSAMDEALRTSQPEAPESIEISGGGDPVNNEAPNPENNVNRTLHRSTW
ncbi:hypothetical protein ABEF95_006770 [Exophiala dermatitidis]